MDQRSNIESGRREMLFGIFLISMAVMVLEIALTRIFSVTLWYHFAFMIVSIALLGFGVSGVFLSLFPFLSRRNNYQNLVILANLFALSSLGAFLLGNRIPLNVLKLHPIFPEQFLYLAIYFLSYALPFFLAGLCIGICLVRMPGEVNRIYFSSLLGSGLGCIVAVYILSKGAVSAIFLASLLSLLAALSFGRKEIAKKAKIAIAIAFVVLFVLFVNCEDLLSVRTAPNKPLEGSEQYVIFKKWNAISRIDVYPNCRHVIAMNEEACQSPIPPQLGVLIDGLSFTPITKFDGDLSTLKFIEASTISLPYELKKNPKVLAIGFGGGLDILSALYYQASSIVGVELNPIIVGLVKKRYRDFSGRLDDYENVRLYTGEGRSFIKRLNEEFDIIQLHGTDTFAATSSGALSLSENYLYTVEAVRDYYSHLREDGILAMSRWFDFPPRETLRLVSIVVETLKREGIEKPENHIIIIKPGKGSGLATLLMKKSEFTDDEIRKIHSLCRNKFLVIYTPQMDAYPSSWTWSEEGKQTKAIFRFFIEKEDKTDFYKKYAYNILPVTDNNPFFFHYFKWTEPPPLLTELKERPIKSLPSQISYPRWRVEHGGGMIVLVVVLTIALFLSLGLILLPLYSFKKRALNAPGKGCFLTYFFCLGIGFMFIEIALMQKFILFLGYPTYSISIVLASLLIFSGIGSYLTAKLKRKMMKGLTLAILLLAGIICSYQLLFLPISQALLQGNLVLRILSSLLILFPLGFLMGMPFPIGIMLVNRYSPSLIPWVWGVNGFASVLGSIFAAILAISFGFSAVFLLASAAYLIALSAMLLLRHRVREG